MTEWYLYWYTYTYIHTYIRLTALCPALPRGAGTRKVKPIWILLKQETVSGSGISWAICKSAPRSRQITTPAPHHLVFYRPDALPAAQPTASKHWIYLHTWTNLQRATAMLCVQMASVFKCLDPSVVLTLVFNASLFVSALSLLFPTAL